MAKTGLLISGDPLRSLGLVAAKLRAIEMTRWNDNETALRITKEDGWTIVSDLGVAASQFADWLNLGPEQVDWE